MKLGEIQDCGACPITKEVCTRYMRGNSPNEYTRGLFCAEWDPDMELENFLVDLNHL